MELTENLGKIFKTYSLFYNLFIIYIYINFILILLFMFILIFPIINNMEIYVKNYRDLILD